MRLIDADALYEQIKERMKNLRVLPAVCRIISEIPVVDAEPVIRCKDCKHYSPYEGEEHKGDCLELVGLESCVYEDDFCSYAKPKARDEE